VPGGTANQPGAQSPYLLEAYVLQVTPALPQGPYVELARVHVTGTNEPVRDAVDPLHPGDNEIDTRNRMVSGPRPLAEINIGVVPLEMTQAGQITHAEGAMNLVRVINNTTPCHAEFKGSINVSNPIDGCDLLLLSGRREFHFASDWVTNVKNFLDKGGVILGQSSREGIDNPDEHPGFRQAFIDLAGQLGVTLRSVERNNPVLQTFHLFAEPPEGVDGRASTVADGGVIYSDADYGALWEGGKVERPADRERIRSALEFGVNIALLASRRAQLRAARLAAH
jgi:hypothetical protein